MKTKSLAGLLIGFFLAANSSVAAHSSRRVSSDNELQRISIGIYDYAHAKPALLLEAERSATAILLKAGVQAVWFACLGDNPSPGNPGCVPRDPTHLSVRILPDSMSHGERAVTSDTLGFALLGPQLSCDAWVFYDRVKDFALNQELTPEHLLGAVIAHELGHLLLNEKVHANAGLMHRSWSYSELLAIEQARLIFSDSEGERIRNGAVARRQVAPVATAALPSLDSRTLTDLR